MSKPCDEKKPCIHKYYDYGENTEACDIDYDGENCPYIKPWGKKHYKEENDDMT